MNTELLHDAMYGVITTVIVMSLWDMYKNMALMNYEAMVVDYNAAIGCFSHSLRRTNLMKKVFDQIEGIKHARIFQLTGGEFRVHCMVGNNMSKLFPSMPFKFYTMAKTRAKAFLEA